MISVIAAVASNGTIGADNCLLWHISEDLRRFKALTSGHPVVMGRKTWESLGRPLPGRHNVVITRNPEYVADGATVVGSLDKALALLKDEQEIFIIGGGEIYRQAMEVADRLYITHVDAEYEGDTCFPDIDPEKWRPVFRERYECGEKFEHPFEYVNYICI